MDNANSKIIEYFIIEANEHLENLEKGILDLGNMAHDSERVNEMFRAAHSIKGGAAMLGYTSIQKTAHRLEDAFKILRENYINVDQKLESLFLKGYDILHELVEKLQGPFGLQDEEANSLVKKGEPLYTELLNYLNDLLSNGGKSLSKEDDGFERLVSAASMSPAGQIKDLLKQMLQVFKQEPNPESRQKLHKLSSELGQVFPHESGWQQLVKMSQAAIANPKHSYRVLAPVVIKELKQGSDLIELGASQKITPSPDLQRLATAKAPQILLPLEPQSVAATLMKVFNRQQLTQLVQILQTAR